MPRGCETHLVAKAHNIGATEAQDGGEDERRLAYLLPTANKTADELYTERLDDDTKLRRRVYELLVSNGCKKLEMLDGLTVERGRAGKKDWVWERLVELGVLKMRVVGALKEE